MVLLPTGGFKDQPVPYPPELALPKDAFGADLAIDPGKRVSVLVPTVLWLGRDRSSNAMHALAGKRFKG